MRWLVAVICVGCSGGETKSADPPTVAKPQVKAESPVEDPRLAKAVYDIDLPRPRVVEVELHHPQIHLVRGQDGRLNISADLFSKPHPELAIPTILAKDATLITRPRN